MPEKIDLSTAIGVYSLTNACSVLVHRIDYMDDRVLFSLNCESPEWCEMTEEYVESSDSLEPGFAFGSLFVPFSEVMRV